jgi:hypothetical protein
MKIHLASGVALLSLLAAACGGDQPKPVEPTATTAPTATDSAASATPAPTDSAPPAPSTAPVASTAPSAAAPSGPPKDGEWDSWSHDQKLAYMKSTVMPQMGKLFHDFDGKKFAEPKCTLCHGAGAKDGSFKMPNPDLPKLDVTPAGFKKMHEKKGPIADFMGKQVVPTMAQLLGEAPYDPKTQKGFGCMECHTKK